MTRQYQYRIADLDGTVHELTLSSVGVPGRDLPRHEQAETWRYELRTGGQTVFVGSDLTTPLRTSPDKAAASVLCFLTLKPGDTDAEYFRDYTSEQLDWAEQHASELSAVVDELSETRAGLGACRIRSSSTAGRRGRLRSADLTRALHMIAPGIPISTEKDDPDMFRVRMRDSDASSLYLIGLNGGAPAWDRAQAWLSALVDVPVDITAADVREDPSTGHRWAFITVRPSGAVDADLAEAVRSDHPCEDRSCDVAVALEQGCPQVAASLLLGGTDAPALEELIEADRAIVPENLERCRGWDDWCEYHSRYGYRCGACGAFTYGDEESAPETCGACREPLEGWEDAGEGGEARRLNRLMESDDWESDPDSGIWIAPRQPVPDPVRGHGNRGLRTPGADFDGAGGGGELGGDSPFRAALAALGSYAIAGQANAEAAGILEARLTLHGFDSDKALMDHVAALREAAWRAQGHARDARMDLFARHAPGEEYHASGQDAGASGFRNGAPPTAPQATVEAEGSTS